MNKDAVLAVQGFVLAGGKSSRMGVDKATLTVGGRSMVSIAVETLRQVCGEVSIVGNRQDLREVAPVVGEARLETGPGAGIEAGLFAALASGGGEWCLFVPVDVPLLPAFLLREFAESMLAAGDEVRGGYVVAGEKTQPLVCMLRRTCLRTVRGALDRDERRVKGLLAEVEAVAWEAPGTVEELARWFFNVNAPGDVAVVEGMLG